MRAWKPSRSLVLFASSSPASSPGSAAACSSAVPSRRSRSDDGGSACDRRRANSGFSARCDSRCRRCQTFPYLHRRRVLAAASRTATAMAAKNNALARRMVESAQESATNAPAASVKARPKNSKAIRPKAALLAIMRSPCAQEEKTAHRRSGSPQRSLRVPPGMDWASFNKFRL